MTKKYSHKVSMNQRKRENKVLSDIRHKGVSEQALRYVFNNYYKDQAQALYRAITKK